MKDRAYRVTKEKAKLILNKYGIEFPEQTEEDVFVWRHLNWKGKYDTYLKCRDSWGEGVEIWIEERKIRDISLFAEYDEEWEPIDD